MVSASQLLQKSGIANLNKRRQEIRKQAQQPQPSQLDIEKNKAAQKQYEQDLAKYEADSAEYNAIQKVYMWAVRGREDMIAGISHSGTPAERAAASEYLAEGWKRGKALGQQIAKEKLIAPTAPKPTTVDALGQGMSVAPKPTTVDALRQGMSVAPKTTYRDPIYDTQGRNTGQYRDVLIPTPKPASQNVVIGGKGDVGGVRNIIKGVGVVVKDITRPTITKQTSSESSAYTNTRYVDTPKNYVSPSTPQINYGVPINPITNRPYSVVSMPPTERENFQQLKEEYGTIGAIARYPSEFVERKTFDYQIQRKLNNPDYQIYQPGSIAKLTGLITSVGTYTIPGVGAGLLAGQGAETILSGRAKKKYNELILQGYSPTTAYALAYGVPIGEVGLGAYGLKADTNLFIRALKPTEQTSFIGIIKRGEGAISDVKVISRTGDDFSLSSEKVFNVPESNIFLGGGKGYRGQDNNIFEFQVLGAGKELPSANLVKDFNVMKQSEEIGQGVFSRGFQRDTGRVLENTGRIIKRTINNPSLWSEQNMLGVIHKVEGTEGVFSFLGGSPKIRIYKKGGVSYVIRKPDVRGNIFLISNAEEEAVNIIKSGTIKKTPFSSTFPELTTLEKQSVLSQINLPKVKTETPKLSNIKIFGGTGNNILDIKETPLMTGGQGLSILPYSGTGQYEQTESNGFINLGKTKVQEDNILINTRQNNLLQFKTPQLEFLKPQLKEELKFLQPQKEIQFLQPTQEQKYIQREEQRMLQLQKTKQILLQQSKVSSISKQKSRQIITPVSNKVTITIKKNEGIKTNKGFGEIDEELFKVFGKRYGKFRELGKTKSEEEAKKLAKEFSIGTLGVSTKIEKGGKPIEFSLGTGFTKSKREPFVIVQERGQRLGSYGERTEIKRSRRRFSFL